MAVKGTRIKGRGACQFTVFTLTKDTEGEPISVPGGADRTVQAYGTWNGASLGLKGSVAVAAKTNSDGEKVVDESPSTASQFFDLTDALQNVIAMTGNDGSAITEAVYWVKPVLTGGDVSTSITVVIMHRAT